MSDILYPLIQSKFDAWLQQKSDDAQVGVCEDLGHCIIATYLAETYEQEFEVSFVGTDQAWYQVKGDDSTKTPLPAWANEVAQNFDDLYLYERLGPEITKFVYTLYMP